MGARTENQDNARGEMGSVDREDVILELETCLTSSCRGFKPGVYCPFNDDVWNSVRDAVAMLKAQEPVEPVFKAYIETDLSYWECGACKAFIFGNAYPNALPENKPKYCGYCGRPVKWE